MSLVFQYGSNMCLKRVNHADRLAGDAKLIGIASTVSRFNLEFTVFSKTNECAAADITPSEEGRNIFGVVYEIPDFLIPRETAKKVGRKSLDAIEGEGTNYTREKVDLVKPDGTEFSALTYVVREKRQDLKTSLAYVKHILNGLKESQIPGEYYQYVVSQIIKNNAILKSELHEHIRSA